MADGFSQVGPAVYLDPKVKRTMETLYVGNFEFSTSIDDLYLAIEANLKGWTRKVFEWRTLQSQESMATRIWVR